MHDWLPTIRISSTEATAITAAPDPVFRPAKPPGFSERPGYVTLLSASPAPPRITDDGICARSRSGG